MHAKTVAVIVSGETEDALLAHLAARGWRAVGLAPPREHEGWSAFWERAATVLAKARAVLLPVWMALDGTSAEPLVHALRQRHASLPILLLASGAVEPTWAAQAARRDPLVRLVWPATASRAEDVLTTMTGGEAGMAEGAVSRR